MVFAQSLILMGRYCGLEGSDSKDRPKMQRCQEPYIIARFLAAPRELGRHDIWDLHGSPAGTRREATVRQTGHDSLAFSVLLL